jgi:hypothetical protein
MARITATLIFVVSGVLMLVGGSGQSSGSADTVRALNGALDIHLHVDPDSDARPIDALDVAKLARARGMRGIVLKNHYDPTGGIAFLVRKEVPGLEVFGGIDLNLTVGGINVAAVEHMTQVKGGWGRMVWMPTHDSENAVRRSKQTRRFVQVSHNGELVPEVLQVLSVIAKHGLVLATGHSSPEEVLMLVREGRRQGVQHIVVTHAMDEPVHMSVAQMRAAAKLGAFIEFDYRRALRPEQVEGMRSVGPGLSILSEFWSDRDTYGGLEGVKKFVATLESRGFTARDLDRMMKENPAKLLGLASP